MGAMERQVPQVKRKNSTNWICPDARLTVVGSVAWRSGPREVATGSAVGAGTWVDSVINNGWVGAGSRVGSGAGRVAVGWATTGAGLAGVAAGAHDAAKTATRIRVGRRRGFILIRGFWGENPYEWHGFSSL